MLEHFQYQQHVLNLGLLHHNLVAYEQMGCLRDGNIILAGKTCLR
jgi:hypothetical protein